MRKFWLHLILQIADSIHRYKERLMKCGDTQVWSTLYFAFGIIFLEILHYLVSFPFYFFLVPKKVMHIYVSDTENNIIKKETPNTHEVKRYDFRRKMALSLLIVILFIWTARKIVNLYISMQI